MGPRIIIKRKDTCKKARSLPPEQREQNGKKEHKLKPI